MFRTQFIRVLFALHLALAMACASSPSQPAAPTLPEGGEEVVFSLQEITCRSCGAKALNALEGRGGVYYASFDAELAEVHVGLNPTDVDPETVRQELIDATGYPVVVGAGQGSYTQEVRFEEAMDVVWLSRAGEDVDIASGLADGKVTVVDFYADWCGPCKDVDREMLSILELNKDVALRKINIVDWESPVAKRYLSGVPELPYVIVYDLRGQEVTRIAGLDLEALRGAVEAGRRP